MMPDEELRQTYEISVDDRGIINLVSLQGVRDPGSNSRLAELIYLDFQEMLGADPQGEFTLLVDLRLVGKGGYASSNARKTYAQMSTHGQLSRLAIVGGNLFFRTVAAFVLRASGRTLNMRWFADKQDATNWLLRSVHHD